MPAFDLKAAKDSGYTDEEIFGFIESENKKGKNLYISKDAIKKEPGIGQKILQGIAQPFLKAGVTLAQPAMIAGRVFEGQPLGEAITATQQDEIDFGAFGKASPIQSPQELVGTGLELAGTLLPGPKALSAAQKVAKGAVRQAVQQGTKAGAIAGGLTSGGQQIQEKGFSPSVIQSTIGGALTGGVLGAVTGGVGAALVKGARGATTAIQKAPEAVQKIKETIADIDIPTKNVLSPFENTKNAIEKKLAQSKLTKEEAERVLRETKLKAREQAQFNKDRANFYMTKAARAARDQTQPTPLELVGKKAEEVLRELNKKLSKFGELKQKAIVSAGNKTIKGIDNLKLKFLNMVDERLGIYLDEKYKVINSTGKVSKITFDQADQNLLSKVYSLLDNLTDTDSVVRIDSTIDAIQNLLYKRKANVAVQVNSIVEGVLKQITGELNNAVKKKVGVTYIRANQKFANIIDIRDSLNKALGMDANKGGALMKRVFSPADAGTKKMFQKIYDITGINLTDEAVLAKFAMEALGDARQKSLLEEIGLIRGTISGGGAFRTLTNAFEAAIRRTATKENIGKKIMEKAIK